MLLEIWLRSVRATHTFLSEAEVQSLSPLVREYLESSGNELWVLCNAGAGALGFMRMVGQAIESLFLAPECTDAAVGGDLPSMRERFGATRDCRRERTKHRGGWLLSGTGFRR